ncbi:MLP-like protein 28 [Beta vulgaris subsp. vulgaris]|uniref:MLP-like protein 28 n=1 Tax=Beta vulgaris subsp. vulgaris TaxID=3555 RepID=UPI0020368FFC|nr:MLP-like protein 28 [Beta vulgaris subsp. vulgaris]
MGVFREDGSKPHDVCNITPHRVQGCGVHEGEFGQSGSGVLIYGKECTSKVIVEAKDDEKLVRFTHIEGFLVEEYKSFVVTLQVTNKDDEITAVTNTCLDQLVRELF